MQTAADYSVQVDDWPPGEKDPAEIKKFFEQFGSVYAVTVVVENATLLNWLGQRKATIRQLNMCVCACVCMCVCVCEWGGGCLGGCLHAFVCNVVQCVQYKH